MPIYEYQCKNCGEVSEHLQKVEDPPLTECPACGGDMEKLLSAPAFQFKGTGWYVTDYAGKKGGKVDSKSAPESGGGGKDSSSSSSSGGGSTKATGS